MAKRPMDNSVLRDFPSAKAIREELGATLRYGDILKKALRLAELKERREREDAAASDRT